MVYQYFYSGELNNVLSVLYRQYTNERTDGRIDRRIERRTDRQTDNILGHYIS